MAWLKKQNWPDRISTALVGSCTNSSYEDISRASDVARQAAAKGAKMKSRFLVTPGSEMIDETIRRDGQMQTLFPTNHMWYGYADLVGWSNILDLRLALSATPRDTITVTVEYHHFRRPEDQGAWINAGGAVVRPGAIGVSNHLGDEVDFTFTWKPVKQVSFLLGWSIFFPGGFVEDTGESPVSNFAYVQGRVTF